MVSWSAVALLCVGCPGRETGVSGDEGSTGADGTTGDDTPTGGVAPDSVIAPVLVTYRPLGAAPVEQALDPLQEYMDISIVADDAVIPAVYDGSSRLEFAGVPEGAYVLKQEDPPVPTLPDVPGVVYAVVTDLRELGLFRKTYSGRPDVAVSADTDTRISLSATGMQPLGADDQFELYSYQADALAYLYPSLDPEDGSNSPLEGATGLDGWTVPWRPDSGRGNWALVDPGQGDDLWLAHLRGRPLVPAPIDAQAIDPWSFATRTSLIEVAKTKSAAMVAGTVTEVTGEFEAVASETASFDVKVDEFLDLLVVGAGSLVGTQCAVHVLLEPGTPKPVIGMTPTLASVEVESMWLPDDPGCEGADCAEEYRYFGDRVVELEYANPYPVGALLAQVECTATTFVKHPETDADERLHSTFIVVGRLADVTKGAISPTLDLVGDVRVNGEVVGPEAVVKGVGTTPTVSFTPPLFGTPESYSVVVVSLEDRIDVDGRVRGSRTVGSIRTTDTTVTIPAGLMRAGAYYYLRVTARQGQGPTAPHPDSYDLAYSTAITGIITP